MLWALTALIINTYREPAYFSSQPHFGPMYVYSVQEKINTVVGWLKVYYVTLLVDMLARASFTCWDDINVIPSATSFANFMRSPDVSDLLIPCRLPYTRPPLLRLSLRRSFRLPLDRYSTMMYRGSNRKNYDLLFFFWSQTTNTTVCTRKPIYIKNTKIKVLFWWHHLRILLNQHFEEFDLWQLFIKLNWSFECWINIDKVRLNLTPC